MSAIFACLLRGRSTPAIRAMIPLLLAVSCQPSALSNCNPFYLALTLLVFRVLADHPHYSLAVDDLALVANLLNRCSYLHKPVLSSQLSVLSDCNCRSLASLGMTKPKRKRIKNLNQNLFIAVHNPPAIQIVRRKIDRDFVSRQYPYKVLPHLAGNVRQHLVFVFQFHLDHGIGQRFDNRCHHFNRVFFTHYPPKSALSS